MSQTSLRASSVTRRVVREKSTQRSTQRKLTRRTSDFSIVFLEGQSAISAQEERSKLAVKKDTILRNFQ